MLTCFFSKNKEDAEKKKVMDEPVSEPKKVAEVAEVIKTEVSRQPSTNGAIFKTFKVHYKDCCMNCVLLLSGILFSRIIFKTRPVTQPAIRRQRRTNLMNFTPSPPRSCKNGCFTYNFTFSVTKVLSLSPIHVTDSMQVNRTSSMPKSVLCYELDKGQYFVITAWRLLNSSVPV